MSLGYSKEFNDATRPGFDPDAAEAAMRRLKDAQDMQDQRAFQRQLSGVAEGTGEISQAVGAARQTAEDAAKADEKERKERTDRAVMLDALNDYEANLEERYGEHFAENLFADLYEGGLVDDDEYARIMAIPDEEERRIAIAAAIQRGIDEGRISPDDLRGHEWAQEWLRRHQAAAAERDHGAALLRDGQRSINDVRTDAQDLASEGIGSDQQERFDESSNNQEANNAVDTGHSGGFNLGGNF